METPQVLILSTSQKSFGETARKTGVWLEELAAPYYLFKEAGLVPVLASPLGGAVPLDPKSESIIVANGITKRFLKDPVLDHHKGITGDAYIQNINDIWVMFYFGAFWKEGGKDGAFNRFACSYDLVNWTDWTGVNLIQPSETYDRQYAHKSFVVKWKGVVYHFYCAVNNKDQRGIALATSKDLGKSKLTFISGN